MRVDFQTIRQGFKRRIGLLTSTALAPVALVVLVVTLSTNSTVTPAGDVLDVQDGQEVIELYQDFHSKLSTYNIFTGFMKVDEEMALESELDFAGDYVNTNDSEGSDDYSETNNQVVGVDEMDNVVTDGKYIYSIDDNGVDITLAYTNLLGAQALSNYIDIEYDMDDSECPTYFNTEGLYVDDDYLIVIGTESTYNCGENVVPEGDYYYGWETDKNIKVYVYNKDDNFTLESKYVVAGRFLGTRKIDDNLFIVANTYIPLGDENIVIDDYLPFYQTNGVKVNAQYENIVYIEGTAPNSYTSFYSLDLDHNQVDMEIVLGDNNYSLYVSQDNIYLAGNIYYFSPLAEVLDLEEPVSETKTAILKVSITGANLEYVNMGVIEGYTLNQFSMDEEDGKLRVATTSSGWGSDINNRLFILDENLEEISRIENLGKEGERIQSVRFVGDYGYVVTFLQTDPFYVINMVNPQLPFVEGELEIPGFSSYLQPLNNSYMLGIGFGDNNGGTNGLKIAVYDISNKTNPVEFSVVIFDYEDFGWGYSTATYNHKDLLVSMSKGIIALPFSTYNYNESTNKSYNSGILVYNFDDLLGLTFSGYVQHEEDTEDEVYVYKSKFIDDYFYTISDKYIQVSLISNPEDIIKSITLD
jgi:uncharacterized secreted protein with C-terminal beta-propeller domain